MILIIMGVAGAGKTVIGQKLSEQFDWPYFEADVFHSAQNKEKMAAGVPLNDADRIPWLKSMARKAAVEASQNKNAIFSCSALKKSYRKLLYEEMGCDKYKFIFLKLSKPVALERLKNRTGHFMKSNMVQSQFDDLEEPTSGELGSDHLLIVDVDSHSVEQIVEFVSNQIINQ